MSLTQFLQSLVNISLRKFYFLFVLIFLYVSSISAHAAGLIIPAGSTVNVNDCTLNVCGDVDNAGTLQVSSGTVGLIGSFLNSGTFTPGTGTLTFNGTSGVQVLNTGGLANALYNLSHTGASTLSMAHAVDINNSFSNTAGTFLTNNFNMNVAKDWTNTATFTPGTSTVFLDGTNQTLHGATSFYNLNKTVAAADTLTLDDTTASPAGQLISHSLVLRGAAGNLLGLRSTTNGTYAKISLQNTGIMSLRYLDVKDSDASGGITLVGGTSSVDTGPNPNLNWLFTNTTLHWNGSVSTDWDDAFNWDEHLLPSPGDTVVIPAAPANQPVLSSEVIIGNLTLSAAGSSVSLNGQNLTVTGTFTNNGNVKLTGTETVTLTMDSAHGTFTYVGNGDGTVNTRVMTINGATNLTFFNLVINDANATKDIFQTNGTLHTNGTLTVTSGTLDTSTNSNPVTADGAITVNGGTWTATNTAITANSSVTISSGVLTAPSATTTTAFVVVGNWTHSGGTFTHSNGKVTFTGTNQTINGSTTFYRWQKVVAAAATLTFDHTGTQTIVNDLILQGASGQLLSIRSDLVGTAAGISLQAGGTQTLSYLDVQDSNASGGVQLLGRNSPDHSVFATYHNTNWAFGNTTVTWTGTTSTDWDTPTNWDIGLVPLAGDVAIIAAAANQPILATNVNVGDLTLNNATTLTLNGKNLTVTSTLSNSGTIKLFGTEVVTINTTDIDSGTFEYNGNGDGTIDTINILDNITVTTPADNTFFNVTINDTHGTKDIFSTSNANLDVKGSLTLSSGTFIAPTNAHTFNLGKNWTQSAGTTFTHSNGKVILNGTNQTISGDTTFYQLNKTVAAADTLTFDHTKTVTVANDLNLNGASGQLLSLRSDLNGTAAAISLQAGATQTISYVDVKDSNAGGGLRLVARTSPDHSDVPTYNNTNWSFGNAVLTWTGTTSTDWDTATNWDLGLIPISGDTAIVAVAANQPILATNINVGLLTLNAGTTLTLNGKNVTVTSTFTNNGNIKLRGTETLTLTMDSAHGTFTYVGNGDGTVDTRTLNINGSTNVNYFNLTIDDPNATKDIFRSNGTVTVNGDLNVSHSTLDISTNSNSLTVAGDITVGGVLTATNATIDANGNVTIAAGGTLTAPAGVTDTAFTIAKGFSNSGTFTHSNGRIVFDTAAAAPIVGSSTFHDFKTGIPGKQFTFANGTTQTISGSFIINGDSTNNIVLHSDAAGSKWSIAVPSAQTISGADVKDSDALNFNITCFNCTDSGNNNARWIFVGLQFTAPLTGRTVGANPTLMGGGLPSTNISIEEVDGAVPPNLVGIVGTATLDSGGRFRMVLGQDQASLGTVSISTLTNGVHRLRLRYLGATSDVVVLTVDTTLALQADKVPQIKFPADGSHVSGSKPIFRGEGKTGQVVTVVANNPTLVGGVPLMILTDIATGFVDTTGKFEVTSTTALSKGTTYVTVTVDGVASSIFTYHLTDPFGVVFDSSSNQPLNNASVSIYRASDHHLAQPGVDLDAADTNPFTTATDGIYHFLAASGDYYMVVSADGYTYPTALTTFPSGRTVTSGSKGESFTVGTTVLEIDHPADGNGFLLRIEKEANKSEAKIGDVVTYVIKIENLSKHNEVKSVLIEDKIPPGFKYLSNRVLYDGLPLTDPTGNRPLVFDIGSINPGTIHYLKYQLVIGAGVTAGKYDNVAVARYSNGVIISNRTTKTVKVIADPLFDLGSVIGKVFYDLNENGIQDPPVYDATEMTTIIEKPVPNVQIVTEDGTVITTDRDGKFSLPGLLPGRHVFRVDERTLPPGTFLTTDKAMIVDVTQGSLAKVNFGINVDNQQVVGKDAQFFNEQIQMTQDHNRPVPRLNAALFDASPVATNPEEIVLYEGVPVRQVEFRIFGNYGAFIDQWHLDVIDKDTKKLVKRFEGNRFNLFDPILWNGRDGDEKLIRPDRNYSYILTVTDSKGRQDRTKEKPIEVRIIKDEQDLKKENSQDAEQLKAIAEQYQKWVDAQLTVNNLDRHDILVEGETMHINRQGQELKALRVLKDGQLFSEVPVTAEHVLTPGQLAKAGIMPAEPKDNVEFILPNGDYSLDVTSVNGGEATASSSAPTPASDSTVIPAASLGTTSSPTGPGNSLKGLERYNRKIKVGDDYLLFVGLGDAKVGYNFDRGNIEPVQNDPQFRPGFYNQGKGAYYLKGKILGKYLVTSSFDSNRQQKELYRKLDPNTYYPIYGDKSSVNYDATNTQGPLYLMVEWDKSTAMWGDYAVDFKDTEFAAFTRDYYGGKVDYQSVANNPYGDPRTKVVVFHAEIKQRPAHNEFLGTGGSLYFLQHKKVIEGSDKIKLEIRDKITGLVVATKDMKNGADYELDEETGRILFWQPVSMIAKSESIVSDSLLDGNPVYVVSDYQYEVTDELKEASEGARVAQAVGNNVVLGGTYVSETQSANNYELKGMDATVHLGPDAKIKAEAAQSQSQSTSSAISTDGGITFSSLSVGNTDSGTAYGLSGDARLFDRLGVSSYYKWVENSFSTPSSLNQQGKETGGMALTFDLTPVTRITARQDIQRLIDNGQLQTQVQVGATETTTTMIQIVHEAQRLKLTGEYQLKQVKDKKDGIESSTNEQGATLAGKAEYALTDKVNVSLEQQVDLTDKNKQVTTAGVEARVTDKLTVRGAEAFSKQGTATKAGFTTQVTDKLAVSTDYGVAINKDGTIAKTTTIGAENKINKDITTTGTVSMTDAGAGTPTTSASFGTKAKISETSSVDAALGVAQNATGGQQRTATLNGTTQVDENTAVQSTVGVNTDQQSGAQTRSMALAATRKIDEKTQTTTTVKVDDDLQTGGKTTTVAFADKSKLNNELQAVTERSFGVGENAATNTGSKYGVVRDKDGHQLEASVTKKNTDDTTNGFSQSNIYGLTGDVNDKLAVQGSIEKARVQNLDGTKTDRTVYSLGTGYVLKDTETAVERLKSSTKVELRLDNSVNNHRQYVFYNAIEGKVTDNLSVNTKIDYSKTVNNTTHQIESRHKEIVLGAAYRPVNFDKLNLIAQYTFKDDQGTPGQIDSTIPTSHSETGADNIGVEKNRMQVFAAEAVYDIDENWQLAEKFAYRINDEKVTGFEFNRTHTWLMIHRINYRIDRNWTIGGEYRKLTQVEAQDSKQGFLLEATRNINDNTQLGIGWNFTQFSDDLTKLSYTSQGPYLRMTGRLYDRTPEEKARARAKWLDERVNHWAWAMVKKELSNKNSKIVLELNKMFALAQEQQKSGHLDESKQVYKDIITAGQMMFDEASEYIRHQIAFEEKLQEYNKTAQEYYKGGEYLKARKIWEKIVEDASTGMVQYPRIQGKDNY